MTSRSSQLKIILLVFLCTLIVARLFSGPPPPHGSIVLSDLGVRTLEQKNFQVLEPLQVNIDATGSVDEREEARGLAAYAWVTEGEDVVWLMNDENIILDGSLAYVEKDTLTLKPGIYTLNFASYGQLQRRSNPTFQRDRRKWRVILYSPDKRRALQVVAHVEVRIDSAGTVQLYSPDKRRTLREVAHSSGMNFQHLIWNATSLEGDEKKNRLLDVHHPIDLKIHAIGELGNHGEIQPLDYSRIEDAVSGRIIWQFSRDNTIWAGGVQENRVFSNTLSLAPGLYRTIAVTNRRHHFDGWIGNPPFYPAGWGLRLSTTDPDGVSVFDPWMQRQAVIAMTQIGDDQQRTKSFTVTDTVAVLLYALGEITGQDREYDFAWLEKENQTDETITRWKMSYDGSVHAGGAQKNRKEVALLRLEPATYTLYYESDGSHSYDFWNAPEPDYPERWGVAMFPVANQGAALIAIR